MPDKPKRKMYIHQASAIAVSGRITWPFTELIPTQSSLALSMDGGHDTIDVPGFQYNRIVSFASAYSEVAGSQRGPDGPFDTLALTVIEKLNIQDVVTCDRVVARISATRTAGMKEPEITTIGSRFEGLRIGNLSFDELDLGAGVVCESTSWTSMHDTLLDPKKKDAVTQATLYDPGAPQPPPPPPAPPQDIAQMPRMLAYSLAPGAGRSAAVKYVPSWVTVPSFGTVYLGEYFISRYSRSLAMLRVEMGSPVGGPVVNGAVTGGGDSYP